MVVLHPTGFVPVAPVGFGPRAFYLTGVSRMRVSAFIDGFNLYHAVDATGMHHLKWLDLRALCEKFAPRPDYDLRTVYYFSAYAT